MVVNPYLRGLAD